MLPERNATINTDVPPTAIRGPSPDAQNGPAKNPLHGRATSLTKGGGTTTLPHPTPRTSGGYAKSATTASQLATSNARSAA